MSDQTDRDCGSFAVPGLANALFLVMGWEGFDPWLLDADEDGKACEPAGSDEGG